MDPILETARDALGVTCDRKRHIVARRGVGSDVAPMLDLRGEDGPLGVFAITEARDEALAMIPVIIGLSDAARVLFVAEGYRAPRPDVEAVEVGELAQRFAAGDIKVDEDVQVLGFDRAGPCVAISALYRYDGRKVRFDEPRESTFDLGDPGAYGGAIPDAVRQGYELQAHRNGPAQTIEAIGAMIGWTAIADNRP